MSRVVGTRLALLLGAVMLIVGQPGCSKPADEWGERPGLRVMTMFAPLYCFAANVAGDDATVLCLLDNQNPHKYDATARDGLKLNRADLFFTVGLDFGDNFCDNLKRGCGNNSLTLVKLGEAPQLKDRLRKMTISPAHAGHGHGEMDPHLWLGIPESIDMVEMIRDTLKAKDPAHAAGYEQRATAYMDKLKKLHADGLEQLAKKQDRNLLSFHESLAYFADSFKLSIVASIEKLPESEPDAKRLRELIHLCKDKNVRLITIEPQLPGRSAATTLLDAIRAQGVPDAAFVEIDTLETVTPGSLTPDYYERKMRQNLDHLAASMK